MSDAEPPRDTLEPALLAESAEELYEHAPCGYLSTRPDGAIVKVNETLLDWTGYDREELLAGRRLQELLSIGGRMYYETHVAPLLSMQGAVREIALDVRRKDGRVVPMLMNTDQKRDAAGQPRIHRSTFFNVSDRREYERELLLARKQAERAAQAKGDFISMVSHEIRTPLNAILGVAHLLGETQATPQQQRYLRILRSSSEGLLALINDVLDFGKIEAGKVTLEERPFDVRELAGGIAENLGVQAVAKRVEVRVEIDARVPERVLGDPLKIRQVLTNLVGNAIKFTAKGFVAIRIDVAEAGADRVAMAFRVVDTGIGIAPERIAHIFEAFTQESYEVTEKYGGSGLGLTISRRLLELHGSRLEVESTPGEGSTFGFTLRFRIAPPEAVPTEPADDEADTLGGLRVLIADDNDVNVFVLTSLLHKWGATFDVVENGRRAIERLAVAQYDVVLMDLRMPEIDGYRATQEIRAMPDGAARTLPIFATSASTRMGEEHRLRAAGFTGFIGKPISPDVLYKTIAPFRRR